LIVEASLRVYEENVEESARTLGANGFQVFWYVTLPLIRPGVIAAAIFAFIISLTQFTVSYFLFSGKTLPLPIWIYQAIYMRQDPLTSVVSVFLVLTAIIAVFGLERLVGVRRIIGS
jgi:ABC-type spermidine/putrescine transport system permease subunit II